MPEFNLSAERPALARLLKVAAILLLAGSSFSAHLVSNAVACEPVCGDGGGSPLPDTDPPPDTDTDTPDTDTPPVDAVVTPPAPEKKLSSRSSETTMPVKIEVVPPAAIKFEIEFMRQSFISDIDVTTQSPVAVALVEAGGDSVYLTNPIMTRMLEMNVRYPETFIFASGLVSTVGTKKFSDTMEKYYAAYNADDRAIKQRMDEILSSLKTMLKFGVSVDVFTKTRSEIKAFLEAKGNTFPDYEAPEQVYLAISSPA